MTIIWQIAARRKLIEIYDYISSDSKENASKYVQDIRKRTNNILAFPEIGKVYNISGTKVVRRVIIAKVISVYYRVEKDRIYVLTIKDNRQNN